MAKKLRDLLSWQVDIVNDADWESTLEKEGLIVIDIYNGWAGPCIVMQNYLRQLKNKLGDAKIVFATAKADEIECLERFQGRCQPQFSLYKNKVLMSRVRGVDQPKLFAAIYRHLTDAPPDYEDIKSPPPEMEEEEIAAKEAMRVKKLRAEKVAELKPLLSKGYTTGIIMPDVVATENIDNIIALITLKEFKILDRKETTLTERSVQELYKDLQQEDYFNDLVAFMTSAPCIVLLLSKDENVIAEWNGLVGPEDVNVAKQVDPECLRALYGTDKIRTGIHGSQDAEGAIREAEILFPDLFKEEEEEEEEDEFTSKKEKKPKEKAEGEEETGEKVEGEVETREKAEGEEETEEGKPTAEPEGKAEMEEKEEVKVVAETEQKEEEQPTIKAEQEAEAEEKEEAKPPVETEQEAKVITEEEKEPKPTIEEAEAKPAGEAEQEAEAKLPGKSELEAEPQPGKETTIPVEAEPEAETRPSVEAEPEVETRPSVEAEPEAETRPSVEAEPEAETRPSIEAEPEAETRPSVEAEPEAETRPSIEAEPEAETRPSVEAEPETETRPSIEPEKETSVETEPKEEIVQQADAEQEEAMPFVETDAEQKTDANEIFEIEHTKQEEEGEKEKMEETGESGEKVEEVEEIKTEPQQEEMNVEVVKEDEPEPIHETGDEEIKPADETVDTAIENETDRTAPPEPSPADELDMAITETEVLNSKNELNRESAGEQSEDRSMESVPIEDSMVDVPGLSSDATEETPTTESL